MFNRLAEQENGAKVNRDLWVNFKHPLKNRGSNSISPPGVDIRMDALAVAIKYRGWVGAGLVKFLWNLAYLDAIRLPLPHV